MKKSIFRLLLFMFLSLTACDTGLKLSGANEGVDPTQIEQARQRILAQQTIDEAINQGATANTPETGTITPGVGSIAGSLSYPSEFIPAQVVVAFQKGTADYYMIATVDGQVTYQIDDLPAGTYHVVAYLNNMAAGYSQAVLCGLRVECTDHSLIDAVVSTGTVTSNINPTDWYAPTGTFPPRP